MREQQGSNEEQRAFNERTEERLDALQKTVDKLAGCAYEMKVADNLRGFLLQYLRLRKARILKGINRDEDEEFASRMEQTQENGLITEDELAAALRLDIIAHVNYPDLGLCTPQ